MDDQNINKINGLSYEEELDVLEAVYKIGKEKGLELLRPDQMKKLADGGRLVENYYKNPILRQTKKINRQSLSVLVTNLIKGLVIKAEQDIKVMFSENFWGKLTDQKKLSVMNYYFVYKYGLSMESMEALFMERR